MRRRVFKNHTSALSYASVIGLLMIAGAAEAQTNSPALQTPGTGEETDQTVTGLGEIVVTAQRRSQALSEVGISVSILDGDTLTTRGITSTSDLAKTVPGFTAADSSLNTPVYSIRGIGLNESSLAANSTIAISVDEVPLPYAAMTQGAILDLQRVEVLKGPQGTLYGLNSTGGAINYIANKPTQEASSGFTVGYGRFNTITGEAYVGGPISDTLSARLSANTVQSGDWQRSYTRDDTLGATHKASGRLIVDWNPTDTLSVSFIGNGWVNTSDTPASQAIAFRVQSPANVGLIGNTLAQQLSPSNPRAANWNPGFDYSRNDNFYQGAVKAALELGQFTLMSISAFSRFEQDAYIDRDGVPTVNYHVQVDGDIESAYQELRLAYDNGVSNFSIGANYRSDEINDDQITYTGESSIQRAAGQPIPLNGIDTQQDVKTYAVFADGEYRINDALSVVGGIRYTSDVRDFRGSTVDTGDGLSAAAFTIVANAQRARFGLPPIPAIQRGGSVTLAPLTFLPGYVNATLDEDNVAYHAGLNYKFAERSLLYASFARGFKAGSFPTLGSIFAIGFDAATQERVDAIEVGFKTSVLENTLQINGAAFFYDYKDKQLRGRLIDPVLGSLSKLVNIPQSEVRGAEIETVWSPALGWLITGAVSYIDTEIKEYTGVNLFGVLQDFSGSELNYTPKWSINFGPSYTAPISDTLDGFIGADVSYRSSTNGFLGDDADLDIDAYTTVDLRAGIESNDGQWRASVYANNVTDEYYWTSVNRGSDTIFRYAGAPRTYGVLLSVKY